LFESVKSLLRSYKSSGLLNASFLAIFNHQEFQDGFFKERTNFALDQGSQQAQSQNLPQALGGGSSTRIQPSFRQQGMTAEQLIEVVVFIKNALEVANSKNVHEN
jgi:hypothetical protein